MISPSSASLGARPRLTSSNVERLIVVTGAERAASHAGMSAATRVAPRPSPRPLASVHGSSDSRRTLTTK